MTCDLLRGHPDINIIHYLPAFYWASAFLLLLLLLQPPLQLGIFFNNAVLLFAKIILLKTNRKKVKFFYIYSFECMCKCCIQLYTLIDSEFNYIFPFFVVVIFLKMYLSPNELTFVAPSLTDARLDSECKTQTYTQKTIMLADIGVVALGLSVAINGSIIY